MDAPSNIKIPDEYMCPITHEVMLKPVKIEPCLHIFDMSAIQAWSAKSSSCPLCRKKIEKLTPDEELEKKICAISEPIKMTPIKKTNLSEKAVNSLDLDSVINKNYILDESKSNRYHALRCVGNKFFYGVDTEINRIKAFYYYTKSAEGCDAVALRMLGKYYLLGDKLHPGLTVDYQEAEKYLWMASEMGDEESINLHIFVRGLFERLGLEQHFGWKTVS